MARASRRLDKPGTLVIREENDCDGDSRASSGAMYRLGESGVADDFVRYKRPGDDEKSSLRMAYADDESGYYEGPRKDVDQGTGAASESTVSAPTWN
ncbi:hypothetical protein FS837_009318, partial [Tulasnella sp. UAMH 9824]